MVPCFRPVAFALLFAAGPTAAQPASRPAGWDRLVVESLKEVHNRGADLYNTGDPVGSYRVYEGALLAVRPLLAHRPAAQKMIDDGFADANRSPGAFRLQAFRLHEAIEQVRAELKSAPPSAGVAKVVEEAPTPRPGKVRPSLAEGPVVRGTLTLGGTPVAGARVVFLRADRTDPDQYAGTTDAVGAYRLSGKAPAPGDYDVAVMPKDAAGVPAKYQSLATSGLTATVGRGGAVCDFDLNSK